MALIIVRRGLVAVIFVRFVACIAIVAATGARDIVPVVAIFRNGGVYGDHACAARAIIDVAGELDIAEAESGRDRRGIVEARIGADHRFTRIAEAYRITLVNGDGGIGGWRGALPQNLRCTFRVKSDAGHRQGHVVADIDGRHHSVCRVADVFHIRCEQCIVTRDQVSGLADIAVELLDALIA